MEKTDNKVIATLVGGAATPSWALECSVCGPIGITLDAQVDSISSAHLQTHC